MDEYIIIIPILILGIFIIASFFGEKTILKRKLKTAGYKHINNYRDEEIAKIVGQVEFVDEPLIAPLSKRECAYYHVLIEQRVKSGDNSSWTTIMEEEKSTTFIIREGNHVAFINDPSPNTYLVKDKNYSSGFRNDATEELEAYLMSEGLKSEDFFGFNKRLRYKEGILEEYEKVAVLGKGIWTEASTLNLPEKYEKVLEITADGSPIYLSDDPDTTLKIVKAKKGSKGKGKRSRKECYRKRRR